MEMIVDQSLKRLRWLNFTAPIQSSFIVAILLSILEVVLLLNIL